MPNYTSAAEITAIVEGLESCRTEKDAFKHKDHLVVAVFYLQGSTVTEAATKLRGSLLRFLDHHSVDLQKYNETITVFWLELIAAVLNKLDPKALLVEKCNAVTEMFDNSEVVLEYYSKEKLFSIEARKSFVRPDLKDWR